MKTSVVVVAYNNFELCSETIESVLSKTHGDYELIIVDNHSLDHRTREYIKDLADHRENVILADPGENIGCHRGFNFGFKIARGDYLVKLDDDTVLRTDGWNDVLIETFEAWNSAAKNKIAFIAPDSNVKHGSEQRSFSIKTTNEDGEEEKYNFNAVVGGTLGFSCVMIPLSTYQEFGPLESRFWQDEEIKKDSLYGGEELYYCQLASKNGYVYGYAMDANVHHLDNEFRDPLYVAWKWALGYRGWTTDDLEKFREDNGTILKVCADWLVTDNDWYKEKALMWQEKITSTGKAY